MRTEPTVLCWPCCTFDQLLPAALPGLGPSQLISPVTSLASGAPIFLSLLCSFALLEHILSEVQRCLRFQQNIAQDFPLNTSSISICKLSYCNKYLILNKINNKISSLSSPENSRPFRKDLGFLDLLCVCLCACTATYGGQKRAAYLPELCLGSLPDSVEVLASFPNGHSSPPEPPSSSLLFYLLVLLEQIL